MSLRRYMDVEVDGKGGGGIANGISFGPVSIHGLSSHEIRPQRRGTSVQGGTVRRPSLFTP